MTFPAGETPAGAIGYGALAEFADATGSDWLLLLVNQITAAATGFTNLQDALERIAEQISFPEFADLLMAAFEGITGSLLNFLPWFINLTDFLGFDLDIDPNNFNPIEFGIQFITHLLNLLNPANWGDIPFFGSLIESIIGEAGDLDSLAAYFADVPIIGDLLDTPFISDLIDVLDSTFAFTTLISTPIQEVVDAVFQAISGLGSTNNLLSELMDVLQNIPFLNILGIGGPADIGAALQSTWDNLISGFVNVIDVGASLADLFNVGNIIGSGSFLGASSWDILGIRNNKPMWDGMLPSSSATLPLTQVGAGTSPGEWLNVFGTQAVMGYKRFGEAMSLGVISWLGGGSTDISDFRVNIYQVDTTTGLRTLVHESSNIVGDLSPDGVNADDWHTYVIDPPIAVAATSVYGAELEVRISSGGIHYVVSQTSWLKDHPFVFPRRMCSVRNPPGGAPPATIDEDDIEYTDEIPWMEWAVETGPGSIFHAPQLFQFSSTGSTTMPIPSWCNHIQVVTLGGGGGGRNKTGGVIGGAGGNAPSWSYDQWDRDDHFDDTETEVAIVVGAAGASAGAGGSSSASITGHSNTSFGGSAGTSGNVSSFDEREGAGPGNLTIFDTTFVGGSPQTAVGQPGNSPGGGGIGGTNSYSGQPGADGSVWVRFTQ